MKWEEIIQEPLLSNTKIFYENTIAYSICYVVRY
jgi:hypothetical protein